MSGSQSHTFALSAKTMTERIRELGPNPLKTKDGNGGLKAEFLDIENDESNFRGRRS